MGLYICDLRFTTMGNRNTIKAVALVRERLKVVINIL